jgi:hypothetical protein
MGIGVPVGWIVGVNVWVVIGEILGVGVAALAVGLVDITEGVMIGFCVLLTISTLDTALVGDGNTRGNTEGSIAAVTEPTQLMTAIIIPAKTLILSVDLSSDIIDFLTLIFQITSDTQNEAINSIEYSIPCLRQLISRRQRILMVVLVS